MKNIFRTLALVAVTVPVLSSCLKEAVPQSGIATEKQVLAGGVEGLVYGLSQSYNTSISGSNFESTGVYTAIGYPEHIVWHGVMTQDMPMRIGGYDYWTAYSQCNYMGNWAYQTYYFRYYYRLAKMATTIIDLCDKENAEDAFYLANGYANRAFIYLDMTRMYEFRKTGTSLDGEYYETLKGLTMPIVTEYTSELATMRNPRAPFYQMYRFILGDLTHAEAAIKRSGVTSAEKNQASLGMIYGNAARFWLELGSRFERHPSDLATQLEHDSDQWPELGEGYQNLPPIGVKSAREAFEKAAYYARSAISLGYTPLTEDQWYDRKNGFNSVNNAWIWAIMMSASDEAVKDGSWMSWISFMSPEAQWGISGAYEGQFMIDAKLFSEIRENDWRRFSWVDPEDLPYIDDWSAVSAEEEDEYRRRFNEKYASRTNLSFDNVYDKSGAVVQYGWKNLCPYVGMKFHPGGGNISTATAGNRTDIPLMRVEEMYFIEAEALAHTDGVGVGITALESFMNTYRCTGGGYVCDASTLREFEKELVRQKRIEFWGEGVTLYDQKRLEMSIMRGYDGSNHDPACQFNSNDGYVAPWTILFIPISERSQNTSLVLNPDPSKVTNKEMKYE